MMSCAETEKNIWIELQASDAAMLEKGVTLIAIKWHISKELRRYKGIGEMVWASESNPGATRFLLKIIPLFVVKDTQIMVAIRKSPD